MRILSSVLTLLASTAFAVEVELQPGTQLILPTAKEAGPLMAKQDAYLKRMSAFDRAARKRVVDAPSVAEFAEYVGSQTLDFSEAEIAKVTSIASTLSVALTPLKLALPPRITIVKTTGKEDVDAPYCRGPLIIIPAGHLARPEGQLADTFAHEIFHVFSSHHPELRERLYGLLGFLPCSEPVFAAEFDARRFTNPDAMAMNFFTILKHEDREIPMIPMLLARSATFDPSNRGGAFAQVEFVLLEVAVADGKATAVLKDNVPITRLTTSVPGYLRAMRKNTGYIWHPEEVLADNFVRLVRPGAKLNAPELPGKLREVMQTAKQPTAP